MTAKRLLTAIFALMMIIFSNLQAQPVLYDDPNTVVPPPPGGGKFPSAAFTTDDNENNAHTGIADGDMDIYLYKTNPVAPIEFNIFVTTAVITSAQLSILAYDVDWSSGEKDEVFLNGHYVGDLTGVNNEWTTTVLSVNPAWVNDAGTNGGKNLVQINIDVLTAGSWAVEVDWGQLILNHGGGLASFRYVTLDKPTYCNGQCVKVTEEIDANPSMSVSVETTLLDPNGNTKVQANRSLTATSGNEPFTETLCLPANPDLGTWKVRAICYNASYVQQDIKTVDFTVTDPCPPAGVPTLSQWGLIIFGCVLLIFGGFYIMKIGGSSV
ncbi:MAG: IPTL-CTERM sorting domain-containing protein [Bacteroidota bacterium]